MRNRTVAGTVSGILKGDFDRENPARGCNRLGRWVGWVLQWRLALLRSEGAVAAKGFVRQASRRNGGSERQRSSVTNFTGVGVDGIQEHTN